MITSNCPLRHVIAMNLQLVLAIKQLLSGFEKSNFVSLLNLPQQVEEYGTIYLHWEGVRERFIQHVKPSLINMRSSVSYLVKKMKQIYQDNTLQYV